MRNLLLTLMVASTLLLVAGPASAAVAGGHGFYAGNDGNGSEFSLHYHSGLITNFKHGQHVVFESMTVRNGYFDATTDSGIRVYGYWVSHTRIVGSLQFVHSDNPKHKWAWRADLQG